MLFFSFISDGLSLWLLTPPCVLVCSQTRLQHPRPPSSMATAFCSPQLFFDAACAAVATSSKSSGLTFCVHVVKHFIGRPSCPSVWGRPITAPHLDESLAGAPGSHVQQYCPLRKGFLSRCSWMWRCLADVWRCSLSLFSAAIVYKSLQRRLPDLLLRFSQLLSNITACTHIFSSSFDLEFVPLTFFMPMKSAIRDRYERFQRRSGRFNFCVFPTAVFSANDVAFTDKSHRPETS